MRWHIRELRVDGLQHRLSARKMESWGALLRRLESAVTMSFCWVAFQCFRSWLERFPQRTFGSRDLWICTHQRTGEQVCLPRQISTSTCSCLPQQQITERCIFVCCGHHVDEFLASVAATAACYRGCRSYLCWLISLRGRCCCCYCYCCSWLVTNQPINLSRWRSWKQ